MTEQLLQESQLEAVFLRYALEQLARRCDDLADECDALHGIAALARKASAVSTVEAARLAKQIASPPPGDDPPPAGAGGGGAPSQSNDSDSPSPATAPSTPRSRGRSWVEGGFGVDSTRNGGATR